MVSTAPNALDLSPTPTSPNFQLKIYPTLSMTFHGIVYHHYILPCPPPLTHLAANNWGLPSKSPNIQRAPSTIQRKRNNHQSIVINNKHCCSTPNSPHPSPTFEQTDTKSPACAVSPPACLATLIQCCLALLTVQPLFQTQFAQYRRRSSPARSIWDEDKISFQNICQYYSQPQGRQKLLKVNKFKPKTIQAWYDTRIMIAVAKMKCIFDNIRSVKDGVRELCVHFGYSFARIHLGLILYLSLSLSKCLLITDDRWIRAIQQHKQQSTNFKPKQLAQLCSDSF